MYMYFLFFRFFSFSFSKLDRLYFKYFKIQLCPQKLEVCLHSRHQHLGVTKGKLCVYSKLGDFFVLHKKVNRYTHNIFQKLCITALCSTEQTTLNQCPQGHPNTPCQTPLGIGEKEEKHIHTTKTFISLKMMKVITLRLFYNCRLKPLRIAFLLIILNVSELLHTPKTIKEN